MWTTIVQVTLAPAARLALVQVRVPAASAQAGLLAETKLVPAGTASVSVKPALSEGPRLSTLTVKVSSVPAVAGSGAAVLVTFRSALVFTVVEVVLEVLLPELGSVVPSELTLALLCSTVPSATEEATVTWMVKLGVPPAATPLVFEQVTSWPTAEQVAEEPLDWKLVPAGSVSVVWKPPMLSEG